MSINRTPSLTQLQRALELTQKIQELEAELTSVLGGQVSPSAAAGAPAAVSAESAPKKRGRKPGSKNKTKRGRKPKAESGESSAKAAKPARGGGSAKFTDEWRAKLAEAARARWARKRQS